MITIKIMITSKIMTFRTYYRLIGSSGRS